MNQPVKLAFSVSEAAIRLGVCRDLVYQAIRCGRLRARKSGRRTLILRDDLESYLRSLPEIELPRST